MEPEASHAAGGESAHDLDVDQLDALVRVLSDRFLRRILFVISDRPGSTIRQLAEQLGESSRRVRHHLTALLEARLVVVDDERHREGVIERTYRSVALPLLWDGAWPGDIGEIHRNGIAFEVVRMTLADVSDALRAGIFARRHGWQATRISRQVDERGWDELAEVHRRAFEDTMKIVDRATKRLAGTAERTIPVVSSVLLFESDSEEDSTR
jgi:DNA-binding transcriptional ArsR family regulator